MKFQASTKSHRTKNPIRKIVDNLKSPLNHPKRFLNLGLGDPTLHGNIERPQVLTQIVKDVLSNYNNDGYGPSVGLFGARQAIAKYSSTENCIVSPDDVIIGSGCSGAIELVISVLVNPGDNILVPRPGFPLYQVITESLGGEVFKYDVLPENNWECNLVQMESLINEKTKAILINNPSNPCGSNFSRDHLYAIAMLAKKHNLPVIADEIYGGVVFKGTFTPINTVCQDIVVLSVGGIAKQFVVPGWRVGWLVFHDRTADKIGSELLIGLKSLSQLILGANSIIQACLPKLLTSEPNSADDISLKAFSTKYLNILSTNSDVCCNEVRIWNNTLRNIHDKDLLTISTPCGAMYTMIGIDMDQLDDSIPDDAEFARLYLLEENVSVLPGQCFGMKNYIRFVICPTAEILRDAFTRLGEFCLRHMKVVPATA